MDRLTFDRDGRPLDHEYLYCRGDQWRYRLRIERRGTRGGRAS
jgi:GntR family transcriptional regulator